MITRAFRTFEHDHTFQALASSDGTLMRDELRFSAPLGALGLLAESLVLARHMTKFLKRRNDVIRRVAEDKDAAWRRYVDP